MPTRGRVSVQWIQAGIPYDMLMQLRAFLGVALVAGLFVSPALRASDTLNDRLKRIYSSGAFAGKGFGPARWIRNGSAFTSIESSVAVPGSREIIEYDTATGKRTIMVPAAQLKPDKTAKPLTIEDYQWDEDSKRLLIFTETRKAWRSNTRGDYWVLDRASGALKKLGGDKPASSLMFAKFSPDGSHVAWVCANNLYVEDADGGNIRAITTDGSDTRINGASDWVYEEELNVRDGFRWSPDGKHIAFWQFDLTGVQQFAIINNTDALYPKVTNIPYPKVGTKNSSVRIGVVSVEGGSPKWMAAPGDPREHYIFRIDWAGNNDVMIGQLNRKQNVASVFLANADTGAVKSVFEDRDEAWVDVPENGIAQFESRGFDWINGRKSFLWLSDRDGWRHAYFVPRAGGDPALITSFPGDVISAVGTDPESKWIYFMASPANATQRYLFRAPLDGKEAPVRITPEQSGSHTYRMSPDCRWAFHTYSRFDRPPVVDLVSIPEHKSIRVLESNSALRANVASVLEPPVEFLRLQVEDANLDGWLIKPRDFDATKKYPLIIVVYGEPAGTTVMDAWGGSGGLFHRALAEEGYLVASFDNRGTPAPKGRAWRKSIYGAVGVLSSKDQAEAVLTLARLRPYVDLKRVGIWGWSGGGSNTLNLMFRSPELFKVGVAVAPVPDQKLYDTIYQERYMGLPDENAAGYLAGSPINYAEGLTGRLLIVHGSGDDNVHHQGTQMLVNKLIELNKDFDYMEYPNRTHSISEGSGTTLHVYSLIARYFARNLPAGAR